MQDRISLALVGIGVEPGLSDVFARYAVDHLFSQVDELGTRDGSNLVVLDDDGNRLGMLDGQRMRAARVVFDIGVHLGLPAPAEYGGGTWDAEKGWALLRANLHQAEPFVRFEWTRYLGWPGQAPSYLVGQRLWQRIREAARVAVGDAFDLAAFHSRALALGALPLEVLAAAV